MTVLSVVLLLLAAVLLCAEAFFPGFGVMGISGIILLIVSTVITVLYVPYGGIVVLAEYGIMAASLLGAIRYAKSKQMYENLILKENLNEDIKEYGNLDQLLGQLGLTKTPLRPVGNVDFGGVTMEVMSDGGFIPENVQVKAVEVKNQTLVVSTVPNVN